MKRKTYWENFNEGDGGWRADMREPLLTMDGAAQCYSPWSVDANHAPPGAGYLHLLMYLHTTAQLVGDPQLRKRNRFIREGHSLDFLDAHVTVRTRGKVDFAGPLYNYAEPMEDLQELAVPKMYLLFQSSGGRNWPRANYLLTADPVELTKSWAETTLKLSADPERWTYLGSRHDLTHKYGSLPLEEVLRCVDVDLIFVLFPLTIQSLPTQHSESMHTRWAGRDYPPDQRYLPKGLVQFDFVRIDYA
jgi:hypothetical protein